MDGPQFITLLNGVSVRVELNMNSLGAFVNLTGVEIHDLGNYTKDLFTLRTLIWCAIREGENLEDREFLLTENELGRLLRAPQIQAFFNIITTQVVPSSLKKKPLQERLAIMNPIMRLN